MTIRMDFAESIAPDQVEDPGYVCIAADPPWNEKGGSRGADKHYPLIETADIPAVMMRSPKWQPARNSHLFLWVTSNFVPDGLFVMKALGFRFVSSMVWVKPSIGLGQYLRLRHELVLFGVRGRRHTSDRAVDSVVEAPRGRHSQKPEEFYRRFERVSGDGPRLEMFARELRAGWDVWGNEAPTSVC